MRCYYHRDRDAVGLCKSCGKGLCEDCQTDLGAGLACKGRCEDSVHGLIALVQHNVRAVPTAKALLRLNRPVSLGASLFMLAAGGTFIALGALDARVRPIAVIGGILCAFGVLALILVWRIPRVPESHKEK
jgi:hypothetical protein